MTTIERLKALVEIYENITLNWDNNPDLEGLDRAMSVNAAEIYDKYIGWSTSDMESEILREVKKL